MKDKLYKRLLNERRQIVINVYLITYILGLLGASFSIVMNPTYPFMVKVTNLISVFIYVGLVLLGLYLFRNQYNQIIFEWLLTAFNIGLYILTFFIIYIAKMVVLGLWMPLYAVLMLSLYKQRQFIIFMAIHASFLVYFLASGTYDTYQLSRSTYLSMLVVTIITTMMALRLIRLTNKYQENMVEDMLEINEKNIELLALNEEYLAAEEELTRNYDEIRGLNQKLNGANEQMEQLLDASEDIIFHFCPKDRKYSNTEHFDMVFPRKSHHDHDLIVRLTDMMKEANQLGFKRQWEKIISERSRRSLMEIELTDDAGYTNYYRMTAVAYISEINDQPMIVVGMKDMTKETIQRLRIYDLAFKDSLTGCANRYGFVQQLDHRLASGLHVAYVVLIDLKGFNEINNTMGYESGDAILRECAHVLKKKMGNPDLVGRIANDVFGLVIDKKFKEDELLDFIHSIPRSIEYRQSSIILDCNMGIAKCDDSGADAELLLVRADLALASAKKIKKQDYLFYSHSISDDISERVTIIQQMQKDIDKNKFHLVYQPIMDADSRSVCGYEALARWHNEILGSIPPATFIELAESTSLIFPLSALLFRKVASFVAETQSISPDLTVTVNVSSILLANDAFAKEFIEIFCQDSLDLSKVAVEVTESAFIENEDLAIEQLNQLRNHDIKVYLDDFGTGYSSLSYLDRLPIDVLKIDRTFLLDMNKDKRKQSMISTIAAMAGNLGLTTVAEGIEDESTYLMLKANGIDKIQGFWFSKPLSEEDVKKQLKEK